MPKIEVWSWSLKLKSEFEGLELAKWKMIKPRIKKTQIKFEKHRRRKKLVQTSQILTPMLTIIQQRKMHAYKIAYLGVKSRTLIRELIPIIRFLWRGTVDPVHIQYHQKLKPQQSEWHTDKPGQSWTKLSYRIWPTENLLTRFNKTPWSHRGLVVWSPRMVGSLESSTDNW